MFNKEYPKSCTMVGTSFEGSYTTINLISPLIVGSGNWSYKRDAGIFFTGYTYSDILSILKLGRIDISFRGGIHVQ
jgi:hypothetical protein